MKHSRLFIVVISLFSTTLIFSQISHGGTPYFLQPSLLRSESSLLRSAPENFFIEMPPFDLDSILREDSINKGNMRGSYSFAHKFYTHIDIDDATQTVLPDGTTIKQVGIHSAGAYSINLLLSDFEIPPGGKLFVYNADYSYVVGSFDYRNNSPDKVLPIQPVAGESIIVEYSEPANVPFKGHFIISEVNHDYLDFFRREPGTDNGSDFACMPDVFCSDAADETVRSTVLVVINGTTACTGSLLNNTLDDGTPYLLTAVHCLNDSLNYPKGMDYYNNKAGTIVAFFNYNRPVCDANIKMRGSEEMSLAGASARVILETKDIALLELLDSPPDYFNTYYAGWDMDLNGRKSKYTNVHHPSGAVKKYGMADSIRIYPNPNISGLTGIDATNLWEINGGWKVGSTYAGSSGSPLFDENQLVIGGLTGGSSNCSGVSPDGKTDYFFALGKGWETGDSINQLKTYLDPENKGFVQYFGKDPNQINPVIRLANAQYAEGDSLITSVLDSPNQGFVFGNSNLKTLEFAEEFTVANPVEIFGIYLLIPGMSSFSYASGVTVSVYTGDSSPEIKIDSARFVPQYLNYSNSIFSPVNRSLTLPTETFVVFAQPVLVMTGKFFISYSIDYSTTSKFCVYNTKWQDATHPNTAWLKDEVKKWIPATAYEAKPLNTSLAIQPLIRNTSDTQIVIIPDRKSDYFYYDRSGRTLTLKESMKAEGQIAIYSVGGQLLEKLQIQPDQLTAILRGRPQGTISIVKITNNNFSYTGKIIY